MVKIIDMDLENIDFPTPRDEDQENEGSTPSSKSQSDAKLEGIEENFGSENAVNKFTIHNYELAKNFMKGRQCGRENTPTRNRETKQRKLKLAKINANIPKVNRGKKVWGEDLQLSPVHSLSDKVESLERSNKEKSDKISMLIYLKFLEVELKNFKKKVRVVRVQSSRKGKRSSIRGRRMKRLKKRGMQKNMPHLPISKTKNTSVNQDKNFCSK